MTKKIVPFEISLKSTKRAGFTFQPRPQILTNDANAAELNFIITDTSTEELAGSTATVLLFMKDGSFFQNTDVTRVNNTFVYTIKPNQAKHQGVAQVQLVVKIGSVENASPLMEVEIVGGLESKPIVEREIQDWTSLTAEAKAFVEQIEGFTLESFVENKIGEELANLETNYATRLTGLEQKDNQITAQLAQTEKQVKNVANDGYAQGIVPNDDTKATENTAILKTLLTDASKPTYLPPGEIAFNDTLAVGADCQLFGTSTTFLKLINPNKDGMIIDKRSIIEKIWLKLPLNHTKAGIVLDGTNQVRNAKGKNIRVEGTGFTSTGIKVTAMNPGDLVGYTEYENIHISGCLYDILMEDGQDNGGGWANANRFKNLTLYGVYGIHMTGSKSAGNKFDLQFQTSAETDTAIYCEGDSNEFNGFVWDINQYGEGKKIFNLAKGSRGNIINLPETSTLDRYTVDKGRDNRIVFKKEHMPLNVIGNASVFDDSFHYNKSIFFGEQDDCLAYFDKKSNTTVTVSGNKEWSWSNSFLFNPDTDANSIGIKFNDPTTIPIVIELETTNPIDNMYMIGMLFNAAIPDSYKVEVATTQFGAYSERANVTGNSKANIIVPLATYGEDVYKIKITITKAVYNPTINPSNKISLRRIYGANNGVHFNSPFIKKGGGEAYGNLVFGASSIGPVMTTPDGTKKYRLGVDNAGTLISRLIT